VRILTAVFVAAAGLVAGGPSRLDGADDANQQAAAQARMRPITCRSRRPKTDPAKAWPVPSVGTKPQGAAAHRDGARASASMKTAPGW